MSHPAENDAPHPVLIVEVGDSYIDGLRTERSHAVERGDTARVADVDAELAAVGGSVPSQVELEGDPVETADDPSAPEQAVPAKAKRARKS